MDMLSDMNDTHEEKVAVSKILIWYNKKYSIINEIFIQQDINV